MVPDQAMFKFWPEWKTASGYVEPDLVVHFTKGNQPLLNIILEVKWDSPLSPPCELVRQWRYHLPDDTETWLHFYLVKDSANGWNDITDSLKYFAEDCPAGCTNCDDKLVKKGLSNGRKFKVSDWNERLGCIGWRHLVNAVRDNPQGHPEWGKGVPVFFQWQGIVPFTGFTSLLPKENIGIISPDDEVFFHREPWFGFLYDLTINCDEIEMFFKDLK